MWCKRANAFCTSARTSELVAELQRGTPPKGMLGLKSWLSSTPPPASHAPGRLGRKGRLFLMCLPGGGAFSRIHTGGDWKTLANEAGDWKTLANDAAWCGHHCLPLAFQDGYFRAGACAEGGQGELGCASIWILVYWSVPVGLGNLKIFSRLVT